MKETAQDFEHQELLDSVWFKTRPPQVQALIREFPLSTTVDLDGKTLYVLGYTEGDRLIMSPIDPRVDYNAAMDQRVYLCAEHLRPRPTER